MKQDENAALLKKGDNIVLYQRKYIKLITQFQENNDIFNLDETWMVNAGHSVCKD